MSADTTDPRDCTCPWTDESTWTTYGSAVEPGSQREPDPDCPAHRTPERAANAAIIACWSTHPETPTPHPGCCIPAGTEAARPAHHNEAADSLDAHAQARIRTAPDALARARAEGIAEAATLLRSTARDLEGGDRA